jgi:hypothetical protein
MSWPEPTPLQVGEGAVTRLVYEFRTLLGEREYVELLDILADLVSHDLAEGAEWDDWGYPQLGSGRTPTLLQVGSCILRGTVFELREQVSESDYVTLLNFAAQLVPEELAEQADWAEWEQRRS